MKRLFIVSFVLTLLLGSYACNAQSDKNTATTSVASDKIEVYYFHFTRRCITCNTVENVTKSTIETAYATQFKDGAIAFSSINLDDATNKELAKKCEIQGQSLLFIGKGKRVDLTAQAFMNARSNPEKLTAEIKKVVDEMLK